MNFLNKVSDVVLYIIVIVALIAIPVVAGIAFRAYPVLLVIVIIITSLVSFISLKRIKTTNTSPADVVSAMMIVGVVGIIMMFSEYTKYKASITSLFLSGKIKSHEVLVDGDGETQEHYDTVYNFSLANKQNQNAAEIINWILLVISFSAIYLNWRIYNKANQLKEYYEERKKYSRIY